MIFSFAFFFYEIKYLHLILSALKKRSVNHFILYQGSGKDPQHK